MVALALNLLLVLAALAYFGAVLTLPGIAGLVLLIGMAVDSNVLIFERIREELRAGKSVPAAIKTGFEKAFLTIIDTHVTTVVACVFLGLLGSGPVPRVCCDPGHRTRGQRVHGRFRFPDYLPVGSASCARTANYQYLRQDLRVALWKNLPLDKAAGLGT